MRNAVPEESLDQKLNESQVMRSRPALRDDYGIGVLLQCTHLFQINSGFTLTELSFLA